MLGCKLKGMENAGNVKYKDWKIQGIGKARVVNEMDENSGT